MGEQSRSFTVSTQKEGSGADCTATATAYDGTETPNSPVENFALETRACNADPQVCDAPSIHRITILIPITSFPREDTPSRATWESDFALGVGAAIRDQAASGRRRLQASLVRPLSLPCGVRAELTRPVTSSRWRRSIRRVWRW
eukprot:COSAG04_NODE_742_length_10668_cov_6.485855_5_plen_144_part_00